MEETPKPIGSYFQIVKRRKWHLILPIVLITASATALAVLLPPYYRSTSTILIEAQEIPKEYVMATVTSFVEQRLQTINQKIMSTTNLLEIINKFNLYPEDREKKTTEEVVEKMREEINLETISTDVIDQRSGRPTTATIAFTLSYIGKSPSTVLKVADTLASLFLKENLQVRERQTKETSLFLEEEMKKVKNDLDKIEKKISEFKAQHMNELPEILQMNLRNVDSMEMTIMNLNSQMRTLKEREGYLQTQISALYTELEHDNDRKRMENLKLDLLSLKSKYSEEYPDIIRIKSEITELERNLKSSKHQDKNENKPDNPTYITLASQLASIKTEIDSLKGQIKETEQKKTQYEKYIENTAIVEGDYNALISERNNTKAKYEDLIRKVMEARVAHGLEIEQKGERFTLIDPARLPEKPFKPNKVVIVLIGTILSIGAGFGLVALAEFSDTSIRDLQDIAKITSIPVITKVPVIITDEDQNKSIQTKFLIAAVLVLCIISSILLFHLFYMDLNVVWAKLLRKL